MLGQVMGKETRELLGEMNAEWPRATNVHYNFPGQEKHRGMNWDLGPGTWDLQLVEVMHLPHLCISGA